MLRLLWSKKQIYQRFAKGRDFMGYLGQINHYRISARAKSAPSSVIDHMTPWIEACPPLESS